MDTLRAYFAQSAPPTRVLVVDNDPEESARAVIEAAQVAGMPVLYHASGDNLGPAGGAARALQVLDQLGFDEAWTLWIDDDDPPYKADTMERLAKLAYAATDDIAAFGRAGHKFDWRKGHLRRVPNRELEPITTDVDYIAGGRQMLLRRSAAAAVGGPDPSLFFGFEEPDFCLRLRKAGFRLQVDSERWLEVRSEVRTRNSRGIQRDPNSIWREYYAVRNYIYCMNKHFDRPDLAARWAARSIAKLPFATRYGPRYARSYASLVLRGIRDGYTENMGRTVLPGGR